MVSGVTRRSGEEPAAGGERFGVATRHRGGTVVISLSGELDHDTAEPLRHALAQEVRAGARRIVVDCGGLHFCDSTGLNVLLHGRLDAQEGGGRVDLAALRPPVARMFEITGAQAVFRLYAGVDEALADERTL
ncbi:STAS domain-containing protein [Streptomyces peucetius]|uniref:Anti-sigma factor antagonist n=1 Tax=Streptomyces peucetius TaxID=1950 RepID=A0ABY6I032_STRPE|nr:STAS domain-containing protein [Streptomyces peucetius]UYQ60326.1 STAS domain-containing protein [Streptomyces peucetius]